MVNQTIQIYGRIKPTKKATAVYSVNNEDQAGATVQFVVPKDLADGFVNNKRECYKFRFKKVFDQATKQEDIFENIAKPVADSVLAGYNGTIFAYGQTGSGKTFTVTGGAERYIDRGIIPRTLSYLFERFSQDSSMMYTSHISYLEIYNETGYDLLDSRHEASRLEDLPKVHIVEDPNQNIHLKNLSMQQATNEEEALNLLFVGDTNRVIAETPVNQASTRSHCVFTVHICRREPGSATLRRSKLHLVDLAGSDRASKTGLDGHLLTESKYINLSLHFLEQVIIALSEKNRSHIPYRNSMLTLVLKDSLGGNCMTTMIATMAVEKRNLDESISTCRFSQRVALIKNEAVLNEELDSALLIARLKREVVSLKEELALVSGQPRNDQLAAEEIQKLAEQVKSFLDDPDPDVTLSVGADMRKIHRCFSMLKILILDKQGARKRLRNGQESPLREEKTKDGRRDAEEEVAKLKEMLKQRDVEISILLKMLKERKRAQDATAQLANVSIDQSPEAAAESTTPPTTEESAGTNSAVHEGRALQYMKKGPQLSMGKQEALELFIKDHQDNVTMEDNKTILKQRSTDAKRLGDQLSEARNRITELKKHMELRRRQRAAHGVVENPSEAGDEKEDHVEQKLRKKIEEERKAYKSTVGRLKALRTEIEHLQLLLERSKVKLLKDFHEWWSQEASSLQESESGTADAICQSASPDETSQPSSPSTPRPGGARILFPSAAVPAWENKSLDGNVPDGGPSAGWRDLTSTTISTSSVPLTGDQQTDADILAFVKARQNLLKKMGPPRQ